MLKRVFLTNLAVFGGSLVVFTALAFLAFGLAMLLDQALGVDSSWGEFVISLLAGGVVTAAALTLVEWLIHVETKKAEKGPA